MTDPDFRALCAELLEALEIQLDELRFDNRLCKRAHATLSQPAPEPPTDEKLRWRKLEVANARIAELEEQICVLTNSERIAP
jgi:uncharacterized Rossmann fold enzyme